MRFLRKVLKILSISRSKMIPDFTDMLELASVCNLTKAQTIFLSLENVFQ